MSLNHLIQLQTEICKVILFVDSLPLGLESARSKSESVGSMLASLGVYFRRIGLLLEDVQAVLPDWR